MAKRAMGFTDEVKPLPPLPPLPESNESNEPNDKNIAIENVKVKSVAYITEYITDEFEDDKKDDIINEAIHNGEINLNLYRNNNLAPQIPLQISQIPQSPQENSNETNDIQIPSHTYIHGVESAGTREQYKRERERLRRERKEINKAIFKDIRNIGFIGWNVLTLLLAIIYSIAPFFGMNKNIYTIIGSLIAGYVITMSIITVYDFYKNKKADEIARINSERIAR